MPVVINGDTGITQAGEFDSDSTMGFKNRLINGALAIDQRNSGAAVTLTAAGLLYPVDRFAATRGTGTTGITAQRVSGSIVGANAVRMQRANGNSDTPSISFGQVLESANSVGFAGKSATFSFRARCGANFSASGSILTARIGTGTGTDQSAALFWNIGWTGQSNSNTNVTLTTSWQTFSVTASVGASVNQMGVMVYWTPTGTAGADDWVEVEQIQLEIGSTATSFDFRSYGTELALCQRYCQTLTNGEENHGFGLTNGSAFFFSFVSGPVTMRSTPTLSWSGTLNVSDYSSNFATINGVSSIGWSTNSNAFKVNYTLTASPAAKTGGINANGNRVIASSEL